MAQKYYNYFLPGIFALLVFLSNFLSTDIFKNDVQSFPVWFVLSLFVFVCGWLIAKNFGYVLGGKIIFTVSVGMILISSFLVVLFKDYFDMNNLIAENLILYSLRNILLGSMGLFGLVSEVAIEYHKERSDKDLKVQSNENGSSSETDKITELIINEAKLNGEKIVFDAEKKAAQIKERIDRLETKLREFIQIEKEMIKKYENEEKNDL